MKQIILGMGAALAVVGILYFAFTSQVPKKENFPLDESTKTQTQQPQTNTPSNQANNQTNTMQAAPTDLQIIDERVGTGAEAKTGNTVSVNYVGTLLNGTKFDSSYDRGTPFSFTLGQGQVIAGWDKGIAGMKIGGKRKLTIPPQLAYGDRGAGNVIPPNATLVFEVELLEVK